MFLEKICMHIQGQKSGPFPNFYELGTFVLMKFLTVKYEHFLSAKPCLNGICTGAGAGKHNVLQCCTAQTLRA